MLHGTLFCHLFNHRSGRYICVLSFLVSNCSKWANVSSGIEICGSNYLIKSVLLKSLIASVQMQSVFTGSAQKVYIEFYKFQIRYEIHWNDLSHHFSDSNGEIKCWPWWRPTKTCSTQTSSWFGWTNASWGTCDWNDQSACRESWKR